MTDLDSRLRDLVDPTTPRPPRRSLDTLIGQAQARSDRRRRAAVAVLVVAVAVLVVGLAATARRPDPEVTVGPGTLVPTTTEPLWTVNPSVTTGASGSAWTVRVQFDPNQWNFAALSAEVQNVVRHRQTTLTTPRLGGMSMADEHGQPPVDVYFEADPSGLSLANGVADDLRGRPGITSIEIQIAHSIPR